MVPGLTLPLTEMGTRDISRLVKAVVEYSYQCYSLYVPIIYSIGGLSFLQCLGLAQTQLRDFFYNMKQLSHVLYKWIVTILYIYIYIYIYMCVCVCVCVCKKIYIHTHIRSYKICFSVVNKSLLCLARTTFTSVVSKFQRTCHLYLLP